MPQMAGSYFGSSVTYLWKHDDTGAIGLVVNKPLQASIADIFDELEIESAAGESYFRERHVLAGGPVERDKGFILHDAGEKWESSIKITRGDHHHNFEIHSPGHRFGRRPGQLSHRAGLRPAGRPDNSNRNCATTFG